MSHQLKDEMIHTIFDATYQFMGVLTPDGVLIKANKTAMKFAGIHESDCIGKLFWETSWWTHSEEMQKKIRQAVQDSAGGKTIFFEATHISSDGTLHYIDFSLKPVSDENGKVLFLIPEGRDITERKKMEEALKEQVRNANALLKNALERKEKMDEMQKTIEYLENKLREKR